jgi:hypothetical protein
MRAFLLAVLLALALPLPAAAAKIARGPFLQQTTPNRTLVVVDTDVAARVEIEARVGEADIARGQSDGATRHVVELSGLPAATEVEYVVKVDGIAATSPAIFQTPGKPGTTAGRRAVIGVIGDMGSGGANEKANAKRLAERSVDLLLTVGDNSYPKGEKSEWAEKFFAPLAPVLATATVAPSLGDHEYLTPGATGYLDTFVLPPHPFDERAYSFDWGDVHIAVVDSNCLDPVDPATSGCEADLLEAWLDEDLSVSKAPWKILTMHRAALSSGRYGSSAPVARAIIPLAQKHGVDLVFQGHSHSYERTWPVRDRQVVKRSYEEAGAPVYVTTGGGGDWIYTTDIPQPSWSAFRATEYQHLVLTVEGETLKVEAVRPDGSTLDSFALKKTLPPVTEEGREENGVPPIPEPDGSCNSVGPIMPLTIILSLLGGLIRGRGRRSKR